MDGRKQRTKKVLDISLDGFHVVAIRTSDRNNPFRVYRVCTGHRRQIAKYGDFLSVVCFIGDLYRDGADTMTMEELVSWAKARGSIF